MAQTIGNVVVPMRSANSSGSPTARASHEPSSAPMKPTPIDTRNPPGK